MPTLTFAAIAASPEPLAAASRIWARFSRLTGPFPTWTRPRRSSRSSGRQRDAIPYVHDGSVRTIDHGNTRLSILISKPPFTETQGQYLAFIHTYTLLNRRPPAEPGMQRYFRVTPPSVHRIIVELERRGLIHRVPGRPGASSCAYPPKKSRRCDAIEQIPCVGVLAFLSATSFRG